jgi:hypothetical protein
MSDEYLCLTVLGQPGESEAAFKGRLVEFWTHMLRNHPDTYERVYAEATAFGADGGRVGREYMVEPDAAAAVVAELTGQGLDCGPVDPDDVFTRNEVSGRDWFQIPHD